MSIAFADIQNRIGPMRPDKLPRECQIGFQVAARRLAEETFGLQEVQEFTHTAGTFMMPVYVPLTDFKTAVEIFKAEWEDTNGTWHPMRKMNEIQLEATTRHTFNSPGTMHIFTYYQGMFYPNRPPEVDTQVRVVVAYAPLGDYDTVNFGIEYEDALVQGTLAYLLRLPGKNQSFDEARRSEEAFISLASGLRATNLVGAEGYARGSRPLRRYRQNFFNQDVLRF